MTLVFFCSFTILFLRFIHVICITTSFLPVAKKYFIVWTNCILFFHQLLDIWVLEHCVWVFLWTYVFISLGYTGMEFLGHMETSSLTFWGPAKLFSTANASCCLAAFPTSSPVLVIVCHRIVLSHVYLVGEKGGSGRWAQSSRDRVHVSWSHSLFFLPHCVSRKLSEKKMKNKLFWNYLLS